MYQTVRLDQGTMTTADSEGPTQEADPSNRHLDLAYSVLKVWNHAETR
jgi:hypothetical protein